MAQGKKGMVEQNKTVVIRMSEDLYKEIQPILEEEQKSFSGLIRGLLTEKLESRKTVTISNDELARIFTEDSELREKIKAIVAKK